MNQNAFIRNRAEEFDQDNWSTYVLPLYYRDLGLSEARKSCVLQGGRGCGKTALLRYLSFESQFSPSRAVIPDAALRTVGLYLKADSQYFCGFTGNDLSEQKWSHIFEHALCIALCEQAVGAVRALNSSKERVGHFGNLNTLDFATATRGLVGEDIPADIDGFGVWLRTQRHLLTRWFKNTDTVAKPACLPLRELLSALIGEIRAKLSYFHNSVFAVFVDEYENLLDYQQRFLNTLIKSGEPPLIFHIAMKPNGMRTRATTGPESIQEVSDYRLIKIDKLLSPHYKLFCAELFFFRLVQETGVVESQTPIVVNRLRNEECLDARLAEEYRRRVLEEVSRILPGRSLTAISSEILGEGKPQYKRWREIVELGLKQTASDRCVEDFLAPNFPEASVVCAALLHQAAKDPEAVLVELELLKAGKESKFTKGEWIHHFLIGTILLLYLPFRQGIQSQCPIYAGFDAYVRLSGLSIRYFLELCHIAIGSSSPTTNLTDFVVPVEKQSYAALLASRKFRTEVKYCGDEGSRLYAVLNFVGKLFNISQARLSQSEAERTHFAIIGKVDSEKAERVISEAIKWSVFSGGPETKVKGTRFESEDYVLNPIFAPYFGLSMNKGRKVEIPSGEAVSVLSGDQNTFSKLLRDYEKRWGVSESDQLSLDFDD